MDTAERKPLETNAAAQHRFAQYSFGMMATSLLYFVGIFQVIEPGLEAKSIFTETPPHVTDRELSILITAAVSIVGLASSLYCGISHERMHRRVLADWPISKSERVTTDISFFVAGYSLAIATLGLAYAIHPWVCGVLVVSCIIGFIAVIASSWDDMKSDLKSWWGELWSRWTKKPPVDDDG